MENRVKQKKFVSLVLYLHNTQNEVVSFFQKVLPVFRDNFTNFEIVCVNDACTDGTIGVLKEYLEENHCSEMVNIIHMSFFHGLESAMNAGRDLAIGDFIYEFDTAYVDYPSELIMEVYDKLLEGNDIVSAGTRDHVRMTSGIFYFCYNEQRKRKNRTGNFSDCFQACNQPDQVDRAVYSISKSSLFQLRIKYCRYELPFSGKRKEEKAICGRETFPGIRFFYLFHKCDGNGFGSNMRHLFIVVCRNGNFCRKGPDFS